MGFDTFFVTPNPSGMDGQDNQPEPQLVTSLQNEFFQVNFSSNNLISSIYDKTLNKLVNVQQNFYWYNSSTGNNVSSQASGAYIFRPNSSIPFVVNNAPALTQTVLGNVVQQATQNFSNWVQQTVRLYPGQPYIELESTIGPIPINDGFGHEVITRFQTSLNTNNTWYTDQQGLEYIQRVLNHRPTWNLTVNEPVAGNYFPVDTTAFINDLKNGLQFAVMNDRARSAASLTNGELELMLHRRILVDDGRGVGEPLNESTIIRTRQLLTIAAPTTAASYQRTSSVLLNHPPLIAFGPPQPSANFWRSTFALSFVPLTNPLPPNIQLTHLKTMPDGVSVVLRLHHLYAANEDPVLSKPVTLNLNLIFNALIPVNVTEMQLTAVAPLSSVVRYKWNVESEAADSTKEPLVSTLTRNRNGDFVVTLNAMETRTFMVNFKTAFQNDPLLKQPFIHRKK
jgi:lysosomal alpha-mannosidase